MSATITEYASSPKRTAALCMCCDAMVTGVHDWDSDGFVRCPGCDNKLQRKLADPMAPAAKSPKAKSRIEHKAWFVSMMRGRVEIALRKAGGHLNGEFYAMYDALTTQQLDGIR